MITNPTSVNPKSTTYNLNPVMYSDVVVSASVPVFSWGIGGVGVSRLVAGAASCCDGAVSFRDNELCPSKDVRIFAMTKETKSGNVD